MRDTVQRPGCRETTHQRQHFSNFQPVEALGELVRAVEFLDRVGIKKSTLYGQIDRDVFPPPTIVTDPVNDHGWRWTKRVINEYLQGLVQRDDDGIWRYGDGTPIPVSQDWLRSRAKRDAA